MADLQALLNEISADKPCGDYLEYDASYLELGKSILGKPEDPITGEKAQPPNWRDVHKGALSLLERSKDLQLVIYLLRALIQTEGMVGFRDGLKLLHGLLEQYWDDIHPVLDPDDDLDPTARINIIEELSNFESVLRPLSLAPLVESKAIGRFSLRDIQLATDKIDLPEGAAKPDANVIRGAFADVTAETVQATHLAIVESDQLVRDIESIVAEKVGISNGVDLSALSAMLKDVRYAVEQFADGLSSGEQTTVEESEESLAASPGGSAPIKQTVLGGVNSRQDVLKTLDLICRYYAENEPSSPVPVFLQRAKLLVNADFKQIIENLLPEALTQLHVFTGPEPDNSDE